MYVYYLLQYVFVLYTAVGTVCVLYTKYVCTVVLYITEPVGLPLTLAAAQDGRQTDWLWSPSQPCAKHHRQETSWKVSTVNWQRTAEETVASEDWTVERCSCD